MKTAIALTISAVMLTGCASQPIPPNCKQKLVQRINYYPGGGVFHPPQYASYVVYDCSGKPSGIQGVGQPAELEGELTDSQLNKVTVQ